MPFAKGYICDSQGCGNIIPGSDKWSPYIEFKIRFCATCTAKVAKQEPPSELEKAIDGVLLRYKQVQVLWESATESLKKSILAAIAPHIPKVMTRKQVERTVMGILDLHSPTTTTTKDIEVAGLIANALGPVPVPMSRNYTYGD